MVLDSLYEVGLASQCPEYPIKLLKCPTPTLMAIIGSRVAHEGAAVLVDQAQIQGAGENRFDTQLYADQVE